MRYYNKGSMPAGAGFFGKGGLGDKLIGAAKFGAQVLDNPLTHGVVSVLSPELGVGLSGLKKSGLLERIK